jgi:ABC-type branched-subunit amino acid transport system substrate-binding protein
MRIATKVFVAGLLTFAVSGTWNCAFAQSEPIRIGATLRMLGEDGLKIGQMLVDQFEDLNKQGGINGHKVEITLLNDECKSDVGVQNAIKLISEKKVHLLIGSTCSGVTNPIVDVTARSMVPHITPSSTAIDITKKKSAWVFRVSISERFYKAVIGKYTGDNLGKKVAYIWTTDFASQSFAKGMIDYMKQTYNVDPVFQVQTSENETDYRPYFLKMKAAQPEVIAFSGVPVEMARMMTQAQEVGIPASVHRVAQSNAGVSTTPQLSGDAIKGLIFSFGFTPFDDRPVARTFVEMTKTRYGVALPDSDFAGAWDLAQIVKKALSSAKLKLTADSLAEDRTAIRDALANIKDYQGLAAGPIAFCADPTPQCRDGNRTPVLVEYTKGGKDYAQRAKSKLTFDADFGL